MGGGNHITIANGYKEDCNCARDFRVTFLHWLFISPFLQMFYNDVKLISVVTKQNWFNVHGQALLVRTPSSFTR